MNSNKKIDQQDNIVTKALPWRRVVQLLSLLLLLAMLIWGWCELGNQQLFPIKQVQISATYQHLNPKDLQQTIAPFMQGSFFTFNVKQLKRQILQLPWVYQVAISRSWPEKIAIKITEQTPVAIWNQHGLLNADAQIFTPNESSFPHSLPRLNGPEEQATEVLARYQQMQQAFKSLGLSIAQLNFSPVTGWQLILNSGTKILLSNQEVMSHLSSFVSAFPRIVGNKIDKLQRVDLRYNNGFAIKWTHS